MITSKLDVVDVMLFMDIFPTEASFIQVDKCGCVKFPIVSFSALSWALTQKAATREVWYLAVSRIQYSACVLSESQWHD